MLTVVCGHGIEDARSGTVYRGLEVLLQALGMGPFQAFRLSDAVTLSKMLGAPLKQSGEKS